MGRISFSSSDVQIQPFQPTILTSCCHSNVSDVTILTTHCNASIELNLTFQVSNKESILRDVTIACILSLYFTTTNQWTIHIVRIPYDARIIVRTICSKFPSGIYIAYSIQLTTPYPFTGPCACSNYP